MIFKITLQTLMTNLRVPIRVTAALLVNITAIAWMTWIKLLEVPRHSLFTNIQTGSVTQHTSCIIGTCVATFPWDKALRPWGRTIASTYCKI
jgi:hypothetical protein